MKRSNTPRDTEFRRIIEGYIAISGLSKEQISANLGMARMSLYNRLENPGTFRFSELRKLCDMLHIKEEERRKLW